MKPLTHDDLLTLEAYSRERDAMRERVMEHKKKRTLHLGPHLTLLFEDRLTIQYQIQEMLRVERIFEAAGIQEELDSYNPLIPDGDNLKATMLIEYPDPAVRARKLAELHDIENHISLIIGDLPPVVAIADEDLERTTPDKTSAVHFLRFQLSSDHVDAFKSNAAAVFSVDHPAYAHRVEVPATIRDALAADLD